ncbi:MAG TPA: glycerol kinase GlpK [Termitinemataceae bacterium]|uniref:glycerol kinase GlpK n=1 Tax=Treponema sp. J25 TaxID=2094121 RepID=UPI00105405C5|nr:glycerol kinase GlpK [Treponema sp. J25]TCW60709.1 glycerol kinase [Treponema sp. J25]HOJ99180.1 glycerol kinase GlpK [Termitinemataceae bacterium]HOM23183.1 glycerol kinase GlpK [Termitinemataceae bacterium]HPQ00369.1 glycerol kinase GlpK [Termitinemataceae bacterium]
MPLTEYYILALDQGTTSSRAILFNRSGLVIGLSQHPFRQIYPQGGWVEQNPEEIWESQYTAAREAIKAAQITPEQIAAIGITNQRETIILWERRTGKPVYNAIVWQCRRSADICRELKALGHEERIREKTGLILDPYFSATKLMWLFEEVPHLKERAERGEILFGTVDSWLLYKLTGKHLTDYTNASRTMLFNIKTGEWDRELLTLMGIPDVILPEVRPSSGLFASTKTELFGKPIPVTGCAGDQQAALFGHACFEPGDIKNTYGTGCFTLLNTGDRPVTSNHNLLTTIAWRLGGKTTYALEGSVFIAGALIQWLRDELGLIASAPETDNLAQSVPDSGKVIIVPAFVGMGAPYWDPDVRGTIFGLTRGTTKAHLVRAALESIALQSQDLFEAMEADCGKPITVLKADGGASANSFLMQYQADILGKTVVLPEVTEITALGAAYLAGLEVGYWDSLRDIALNWRVRRRFSPLLGEEERQRRIQRWHRAVAVARAFREE